MFGRKNNENDTVVALLAAAIRRDISFGELPPDSKLKIESLRSRYGGSAHSIREALVSLSVEGLVEATAQRGFRVASATAADLEDITRLRGELEVMGLRWSMENGDIAWEGRVLAARHALSRIESFMLEQPETYALEWEEYNRQFHHALMDACGSPRLLDIQDKLYNQSRRFRLAALKEGRINFNNSQKEHDDLATAAIKRDSVHACNLLKIHIQGARSGQ